MAKTQAGKKPQAKQEISEPKKRGRPFGKKVTEPTETETTPQNSDVPPVDDAPENNPDYNMVADVPPADAPVDDVPPPADVPPADVPPAIPDDGMPDNPPIVNYSPLEGQPLDMPHAKPNVNINPKDIPFEIKEPIFTPPPFIDDYAAPPPTPPSGGGGGGAAGGGGTPPPTGGGATGAPPPKPFTNPDLVTSTDKEKEDGAKFLVESTLDAYDLAHRAGRWYLEVAEEDVAAYVAEGKIQLDDIIAQSEAGEDITVGEFIASYNKDVNETIQVSRDFRNKITPVLVRIFIKRGWGFTDEQYALYLITKDLSTKVGMGYMFKKQMSSVLGTLVKVSESKIEAEAKMKTVEEENEALRQRVANFEAMQYQTAAPDTGNPDAAAETTKKTSSAPKSNKLVKLKKVGKPADEDDDVTDFTDVDFEEPEERKNKK